VGKQDIVSNYTTFLAGNLGIDREELAAALRDERRKRASISEGARWRNVVIEETSGTSGVPFNFPKLVAERAMAACEIWKWRRKVDPLVTNRAFYPFLHAPIGFTHPYPPSDVSPDNIQKLYGLLSSKGVRWVHGPPELLRQHATLLREIAQRDVTVKFFEVSGLYLSQEAKSAIEDASITVVNQYGCRETWVIGYGVGSTSEFEILTDNVFVELINESGNPVVDAETTGDIIVTARYPRLMPFIRYRTGDRGCWVPGHVGTRLSLANGEREPGAWRWGKWDSGSRFFRIMLARAYLETGYIPMRYLQIREIGPANFAVVTDDIPRREELCRVLERVCQTSAPRGIEGIFQFRSQALVGEDLDRESTAKPRLFKPRPNVDGAENERYF